MDDNSAIDKLAKTLYGEDPAVVARAIHNTFPGANVYLAVHCGRAHMSGAAKQFCRICGLPITGDLYQPLAADTREGALEPSRDVAAVQRPTSSEESDVRA